MQKGSVLPILLGILLIGGLVGGYWYLNRGAYIQNSPVKKNQESNLKSYKNPKLGFQFQYSKDLKVQEDSEQDFNKRGNGDFRKNFAGYVGYQPGKFVGAVVVLDKTNNFDINPFSIWVFENPDNLDIGKWYDRYWYYPFVWGDFTYNGKFKLSPQDIATISGQTAKVGMVDYQPGSPKFIYLSKNEKMYLIRLIKGAAKEIEKILASFRLLN